MYVCVISICIVNMCRMCFICSLQYRMHPAISQFPSDLFYGGRIMDGIDATKRPPPPGQLSRKNKP